EPAMASSNWRQTGGLRTWVAFFGGSAWTSSHNCSMCFAATCQWSGLGHHCRGKSSCSQPSNAGGTTVSPALQDCGKSMAATGYRCRKCWHWTWSMLDHDRYGSISGSFVALLERFYSIEPLGKSKNGRSRGISRDGEGYA